VRRQGEEIARGAVGLREGTPLNAGALGIAASLGGSTLVVHRRPLVGILASGDELVHVDQYAEVLEGRRIVSSNSYAITAALEDAGCETRYLGIAGDTPESLRAALENARGCDALITSGGISVGKHDYIKDVLLEMRTEFRFWRVRMRPGSPFAFGMVGELGAIPWFGLPGNPVSSAVTFEAFCRPALMRMSGIAAIYRRWILARLADPFDPVPGLTQFVRVRLDQDADGTFVARLTGKQVSAHLSSIAMADGLMIIGEADVAPVDSVYRVMPLGSGLFGSTPPL
jgi:molybdopterin molybdotransferase